MIGDVYLKGYVKLYRKILSNPVFKSPELLQLFIYCLLRANHEEGKAFYGNDEIKIEPGQFITGRFELSKDLKQNESSTYKRLKRLETLHMVALRSNNRNTLVTVVNWELYQSAEKESNSKSTPKEQQSNNKVTTKEQQSNTNKNVKNGRMEEEKIYMVVQHLSLSEENYNKLVTEFGKESVDLKIAYAENYAKLKNYKSLYLTLNNWLKKDVEDKPKDGYRRVD